MGNELVALSIGTRTFALVSGQVYMRFVYRRRMWNELAVFPKRARCDPVRFARLQGIRHLSMVMFVADHVLGATHLVVESRQNGLTFPDEHLEVLRHFKDVAGAIRHKIRLAAGI